jgi:hypothetical protein
VGEDIAHAMRFKESRQVLDIAIVAEHKLSALVPTKPWVVAQPPMLNPDAIRAQIVSTIYDPFPRFQIA